MDGFVGRFHVYIIFTIMTVSKLFQLDVLLLSSTPYAWYMWCFKVHVTYLGHRNSWHCPKLTLLFDLGKFDSDSVYMGLGWYRTLLQLYLHGLHAIYDDLLNMLLYTSEEFTNIYCFCTFISKWPR